MIQKLTATAPATYTIVVDDRQVRVPSGINDLESFRRWAYSDQFPETGRICYFRGEVWVDMSKEQFFSHNQMKQEFNQVLGSLVKALRAGRYIPDGMLITNVPADFSCQPDGSFVSLDSFRSGRVRLVEGKQEGYLELEGTPDMVLEVVSRSSVGKDTKVLHDLYWQAGVPEYWLVDARGERLEFDVFQHGRKGYTATRKQAGWLKSKVFGKSFRLVRQDDPLGHPEYTLEMR